jgi:membrane associated rhomboid family serine protease
LAKYQGKSAVQNASHTIREEIQYILIFIGVLWAVFILSLLFPSLDNFGLVPRTIKGLIGIPAMLFLHANLLHLLGNTIPLFILLALLAGSKARSWEIVIDIVLLGGALLWLLGRSATHIGASGLIFGLISFLIFSGILEKRLLPLIMTLIVGFLYGGTLLRGVLPQIDSHISWDAHLYGAIAGGIVAYMLTREDRDKENAADLSDAKL